MKSVQKYIEVQYENFPKCLYIFSNGFSNICYIYRSLFDWFNERKKNKQRFPFTLYIYKLLPIDLYSNQITKL